MSLKPKVFCVGELADHWARLCTTSGLERLHAEIQHRIRSAAAFPDRTSALRLITARLP